MAQCIVGLSISSRLVRLELSRSYIQRQCRRTAALQLHTIVLLGARNTRKFPVVVRAQSDGDQGSSQYGLGGPGSFFGFGNFQERFVGRAAMVGFVAGVVMEVVTGKGVFAQLGLDPLRIRFPFLLGFLFLLVGGLLGGYVVIQNPPDVSKAPPNAGAGVPRDPLKTFDPKNMETMTTYTRGGVVDRPSGQVTKGREPYMSDLEDENN